MTARPVCHLLAANHDASSLFLQDVFQHLRKVQQELLNSDSEFSLHRVSATCTHTMLLCAPPACPDSQSIIMIVRKGRKSATSSVRAAAVLSTLGVVCMS